MDSIDSTKNARIRLTREQFNVMVKDVRKHKGEESCGLIGGTKATAYRVFPITNSLHDPTRFRMDAVEQVNALMEIERNGWDLLAIYHSHLKGPGVPSKTDTREFAYPGVAYLIIDLSRDALSVRGFRIDEGAWKEIQIMITEQE